MSGEKIMVVEDEWVVADALEYLTSNRAFRNAFPLKQALAEISVHRGTQYDPDVVDACLKIFRGNG